MTTTFDDRSPKSEQLSDDSLATVCEACGHDESLHDATGTRFCRASLDRAVDRGCICRAAGKPATPMYGRGRFSGK
jgi:hypothetical protein